MAFNDIYSLIDYDNQYQDELIEFLLQGYLDLGYTHLDLADLDKDLSDIKHYYPSPSVFKLLIKDRKIVGNVAIKIKDNKAELKRVYVDSSLRGQGLGKELSLWAFDYVKSQGLNSVDIWSGTLCHTAHKLYEKLGAENMQVTRFNGGLDDTYEYYYKKKLD